MKYPEEILEKITKDYNNGLLENDLVELRKTVELPGMEEIFTGGFLNASDLTKQMNGCVTVLPSSSAKRVIAVYNEIKDLDALRNGVIKLSQFIKWLSADNVIHVYVPFPDFVKNELSPEKSTEDCKKFCCDLQSISLPANFLEKMQDWDNVKDEVSELTNISTKQIKERRQLAKKLHKQLSSLDKLIVSNHFFAAEHFFVTKGISLYANNDEPVMEECARAYFLKIFTNQGKEVRKIDFLKKNYGMQLGGKIDIEYTDTLGKHEIRFFIKTHQYGSTSSYSSIMPVDPKELFMYKVLEHTGFGPKAYFFVDPISVGSCFIATQDVSFTKMPSKKAKKFEMFSCLDSDLSKKFADHVLIEDETRKGIARTDILSRIFRLHDVATNPNNFGRVLINEYGNSRSKWKIVDFRVDMMWVYGFPEGIFGGFRDGNGMFQYRGALCDILKNSPEKRRMETAKQVLKEFEIGKLGGNGIITVTETRMPLLGAIDKAFCETVDFLKSNAKCLNINIDNVLGKINCDTDVLCQLNTLQFSDLGDLGRYVVGARENFLALNDGVKKRCTELNKQELVENGNENRYTPH